MKDIKEKEINVGDHVVFIRNATGNPNLATGKVEKIYTCPGREEATVSGNSHVRAKRIMVLPD